VSRLFGTDGIRGVANEPPLTPELAYRLGRQLVPTLQAARGARRVRLVIGRDTRRSGPLLEAALTAGVLSAGGDCFPVGVLPTPGIALLTRAMDADGGIVLSASHNPFADNGIKLFSSEGTKFPDHLEDAIEAGLRGLDQAPRPRGADVGRLVPYPRAEEYYVDYLCRSIPLDPGTAPSCSTARTARPTAWRRGSSGDWAPGSGPWAPGRTAPTSTRARGRSTRRPSARPSGPPAPTRASRSTATATA
jgi:phosphomannomutase